ncbi:GNAT family N-acetyltransferase [Mucilaginibacter sp.]|uniref:GNAT family N-acetyltransferase n=1 Tax=Mucilaginibacter sp. TaxID=1882438 RepID=UPI0026201BDB|nr:GNAT family N-acetyltransferase [Mucilaginibacter sp.]MDB4925264.1 N-acetyltransferase [Mucilaginibacter sp.]
MNNISIRLTQVTLTNLKALHQISRKTFIDSFAHLNTKENMEAYLTDHLTEQKLSEELDHSGSEFYFAENNGEPIGYIKINTGAAQTELQDEDSLEIERIYVIKEYQGQKIGQLLFNKALELAKKANRPYIWLGVWDKNEKAIQFYQKMGFIAFDSHPFKLGDDMQTDIMMKLELI